MATTSAWDPAGEPRWDSSLREGDVAAGQTAAKGAARRLRTGVDGYECALRDRTPQNRATMRRMDAPRYYDLHRTERLAHATPDTQAKAHAYHVRTAPLAKALVDLAPGSLDAAYTGLVSDAFSRSDVEREYMLWRHSLHTGTISGSGMSAPPGVFFERRNGGDSSNLDDTLRDVFGDHTRSPQAATFAFADTPKNSLVRGVTDEKGHMIIGVRPGASEATYQDNAKVPVEQMAHSLLARHFSEEGKAFADHIGGDRPLDHMAMAMAHGVFAGPSIDPESKAAPTDYAVHYTGRAFGLKPAYDAGRFRSHE